MIKFDRPLCTFDLETTGLDRKEDRIVEIAISKLFPNGSFERKERKINPGRKIPKEASDVHGITDEMVSGCDTFAQLAPGIYDFIRGCDLSGFNSNWFDIPFLLAEFERCGMHGAFDGAVFIDVQNIYRKFNPRTLKDAYRQYTGNELDAHHAGNDVFATEDLLDAMMVAHPELASMSLSELSAIGTTGRRGDVSGNLVFNVNNELVFSFGKNKGKRVVDFRDYCIWMENADFPYETKMFLKSYLKAN